MFYKNKPPMTDLETAQQLLKQWENYGTFGLFYGPEPLDFMKTLGLISFHEFSDGDSQVKFCLTSLRIYNYAGHAKDEYFELTSGGSMIIDHDGEAKDPKIMLSLKRAQAQAGWEVHNLVPDYGERVRAWLKSQTDSTI